jgi:hypothetical protein
MKTERLLRCVRGPGFSFARGSGTSFWQTSTTSASDASGIDTAGLLLRGYSSVSSGREGPEAGASQTDYKRTDMRMKDSLLQRVEEVGARLMRNPVLNRGNRFNCSALSLLVPLLLSSARKCRRQYSTLMLAAADDSPERFRLHNFHLPRHKL